MAPSPSLSPAKKIKKMKNINNKKNKNAGDMNLENLQKLGKDLLSSLDHVNNLPILLSVLSPTAPVDKALESLISLQAFFLPLVPEIPPSVSGYSALKPREKEENEPENVYKQWLRSRFDEFVNTLIEISVSSEAPEELKGVAVEALMEFVKQGRDGKYQSAIYHRFVCQMGYDSSFADTLLEFMTAKYFKYVDVRYFTYISISKIAKNFNLQKSGDGGNSTEELSGFRKEIDIHILYNVLSHLAPFEIKDKESSPEMWNQSGHFEGEGEKSSKDLVADEISQKSVKRNNIASSGRITKKLKSKFTKAWLSFLKLPLPLDVYKEVLATVHQNVIPNMENPAILCDFLTKSYDLGGVISVMALSGLFILMTQHRLEYPKFYEKLYALLTPAAFLAKHRAGFFQLLDTCLKSPSISAYLAAAFAKKLSRLALSVPPAGEMLIIALIHNLLRRHPSINFLVNQQDEGETDVSVMVNGYGENESVAAPQAHRKHGIDPFNYEEGDPAKCNAMLSSLWEVWTLRHHYCPLVSRFVASLENDLTIRNKTTEVAVADFSSGSYASVFRQEMRRRVKQVPLAFYRVTPNALFSESDFPMWTFGETLGLKGAS